MSFVSPPTYAPPRTDDPDVSIGSPPTYAPPRTDAPDVSIGSPLTYAQVASIIIFLLMPDDGIVEGSPKHQFWGKDNTKKSVKIYPKSIKINEPTSDTQGTNLKGSCIKNTETTSTFMTGFKRAFGIETRSYFEVTRIQNDEIVITFTTGGKLVFNRRSYDIVV